MAAIYLRHPDHGAKVATMEQEAVADERKGWTRFDPNDLEKVIPVVHHKEPEIEAGHNMFHQTPARRGGRPKGSKNKPKE